MTFEIKCVTNRDPKFYALLGRFLSRREIVRELGHPIWDEDEKRWWIAMAGKQVVGFAALKGEVLCSAFVVPEYRKQGIYARLVRDRVAAGGKFAIATPASRQILEKLGFTAGKQQGKYTRMEISC